MPDRTIEIIRKATPNTGVKIATVYTEAEAEAVIEREVAKDFATMGRLWGGKVQGPFKSEIPTKGLPGVPAYTLIVRDGKILPSGFNEFVFAIEYWGYLREG